MGTRDDPTRGRAAVAAARGRGPFLVEEAPTVTDGAPLEVAGPAGRPRPRAVAETLGYRTTDGRPTWKGTSGAALWRKVWLRRVCNGCGRLLGKATAEEAAAIGAELSVERRSGERNPADAGALKKHAKSGALPDVRGECPQCSPGPPGRTWRIELALRKPLSLNSHMNDLARWAVLSPVRAHAETAAVAAGIPPLMALAVELYYQPAGTAKPPDRLNMVLVLKAFEDGLVAAGLVPHDGAPYGWSPMPQVKPRGENLMLWAVIHETDLTGRYR